MRKRMNGVRIIDKNDPQVVVPEALVLAGEALEDLEVRVWLVLKRYSHYDDGVVVSSVSKKKIAEKVGRSVPMVNKAIDGLEEKRVITIEKVQKEDGFGVYCKYELMNLRVWWSRHGKALKQKAKLAKQVKYTKQIRALNHNRKQPKVLEAIF